MIDFTHCGDPSRRHDFILLFDVTDGNPNGDPDADNQPRQDQETNQGLVTDVCLKRKVRNFVALTQADEKPNRIYVQDRGVYLNDLNAEAHGAVGISKEKAKEPERGKRDEARAWMCANFYDVRMFGAVMSTKVNAGQVRGPLQMTFARSVDPILPMDVTISRVALTDEQEKKRSQQEPRSEASPRDEEAPAIAQEERFGRTGTFGRKAIVPYGLYVGHGFFSAPFAKQTGATRADLELFWTALRNMWDHDHSASRGLMSCRGLYVFSHENGLGSAPAHQLFAKIEYRLKAGVAAPRRYEDYVVTLNREMPTGVTLTPLVEG